MKHMTLRTTNRFAAQGIGAGSDISDSEGEGGGEEDSDASEKEAPPAARGGPPEKKSRSGAESPGLKGDWPMLPKLGNLKSHFGCQADTLSDKSSICHLCKAGTLGFPYSDHTVDAVWYKTYLQQRPWTTPSPLMQLPTLPAPEKFYQFDVFHCMHKGLLAELTGSAIDPRLQTSCSAFVVRIGFSTVGRWCSWILQEQKLAAAHDAVDKDFGSLRPRL